MRKKIDGIDKVAMKKAYVEMGAINLEIVEENFHLETEGAKYYEMGTTESEGEAEKG